MDSRIYRGIPNLKSSTRARRSRMAKWSPLVDACWESLPGPKRCTKPSRRRTLHAIASASMECSSDATSEPRVCATDRAPLQASSSVTYLEISRFRDLGTERNVRYPDTGWCYSSTRQTSNGTPPGFCLLPASICPFRLSTTSGTYLACPSNGPLHRSDAESATLTKPGTTLIDRQVAGLSFQGDWDVADTNDTEAIRAFSSSSSRSISKVIPASKAKTRIPF